MRFTSIGLWVVGSNCSCLVPSWMKLSFQKGRNTSLDKQRQHQHILDWTRNTALILDQLPITSSLQTLPSVYVQSHKSAQWVYQPPVPGYFPTPSKMPSRGTTITKCPLQQSQRREAPFYTHNRTTSQATRTIRTHVSSPAHHDQPQTNYTARACASAPTCQTAPWASWWQAPQRPAPPQR